MKSTQLSSGSLIHYDVVFSVMSYHQVSTILDNAWTEPRKQAPDFPTPNWDALRRAMPDWSGTTPGGSKSTQRDLLCGIAMLVGVGELISERLQKLDRVLPKKRLYRGFGALTFGGLTGMIVSLAALAAALAKGLSGAGSLGVLAFGGALCFLFGGLLFREYKQI